MGRTYAKNVSAPDERREVPNAVFNSISMEGKTFGHGIMQPGWSWEKHIKPIVGGESCQYRHFGYMISGRLRVRMDDGTEAEYGPGSFYLIEPGHTGEIVGDEPSESIEFEEEKGFGETATPQ